MCPRWYQAGSKYWFPKFGGFDSGPNLQPAEGGWAKKRSKCDAVWVFFMHLWSVVVLPLVENPIKKGWFGGTTIFGHPSRWWQLRYFWNAHPENWVKCSGSLEPTDLADIFSTGWTVKQPPTRSFFCQVKWLSTGGFSAPKTTSSHIYNISKLPNPYSFLGGLF